MLWRLQREVRNLKFKGRPEFYNLYGMKLAVRQVDGETYAVPVSPSPIYFTGAELQP